MLGLFIDMYLLENVGQPYQSKCKDCKQPVTQNKAKYCHGEYRSIAEQGRCAHSFLGCAYKKGLCSICGKQILDTTGYVMSSK